MMKYIDLPFAIIGFCLGLVFFSQPVAVIIPELGLGLVVLLALSITAGLVLGYIVKN